MKTYAELITELPVIDQTYYNLNRDQYETIIQLVYAYAWRAGYVEAMEDEHRAEIRRSNVKD